MTAAVPEVLLLDGVLDAEQAAGTVRSILAEQQPDGAVPWFRGHHLDPWDHTEAAMALDTAGEHAAAEAAYRWLAKRQNPDGSWYAGLRLREAGAHRRRGLRRRQGDQLLRLRGGRRLAPPPLHR